MKSARENPASNTLGPGLDDEALESAIHASGYPLQLQVAQNLSGSFRIQEEWSYIDHQTQVSRTIDLVASRRLFEWDEPQPRVRPELNLIVECKQSDLPYVFFLSNHHPWLPDFPTISGLKSKDIVITSDDDPSSWRHSPLSVLDLNRHPFLRTSVPLCATFSKCVRQRKKVVLSGDDPYQSLMLPILKAASHFDGTQTPPPTAHYFDCHIVIGVGVLDAPMVGVRLTDSGTEIELLPWVRVVRHEPTGGVTKFDSSEVRGVEIVHKDYLNQYINHHALRFAGEFAQLALKHSDVLADAEGFVPGGKTAGQTSKLVCSPLRASIRNRECVSSTIGIHE